MTKLATEKWLQENERERELEYASSDCDGYSNGMSNRNNVAACMRGSFPPSSWDRENRIKRIEEVEQEIDNAMEITGPYQFFYKNGQVEDEGINKNGKKGSYSVFSKDGMREKVVQAK